MNRRQVVIFGLAVALAGPVFASDFQDEILASLHDQGYAQITVEITLLGRVKITAIKQSYLREIVLNPRTGEILRDLWMTVDGRVVLNPPIFEDLETRDIGKGNAVELDGESGDDTKDGANSGGSDNSGSENRGSENSGSGNSSSENSSSENNVSDSGGSGGEGSDEGSGHGSGGGHD